MIENIKKTAIITGASKGIGAVISKKLAASGFNLVLNCSKETSLEKLEAVKKKCEEFGSTVFCFVADVSKYEECEKMVEFTKEKFKTIDALINNAGIKKDGLLVRMSCEDFDRVCEVNLKGVFNMTKLVANHMLRQRSGRIVNVSSVVGVKGNAGQFNYCATKAGIIGMTKSAAKEFGKRGVLVNAVAPGFVETEMTEELGEELKQKIKDKIVLSRFAKPEEIAGVVAFLCGKDSSYITGQVILVDGCLLI